jgi:ketosteroid isomerase-like protein
VSEENVAIVRAIYESGAGQSKEAVLAALPEAIPALVHPDAEWVEAPERVDARTYRGHAGIRESWIRWLEQWGEYRVELERVEDHGDQVFVVAREYGEGSGSGATTDATLYVVLTFREGKISLYREFYDEAAAREALA